MKKTVDFVDDLEKSLKGNETYTKTEEEQFEGGEELTSSYGQKRITVGARVENEGDIHLGKPGEYFIGDFLGYTLPEGFKTPLLLFQIKGDTYRLSSTVDLQDKLGRLIPEGKTRCIAPMPVKVIWVGDEKLGKGTMHVFKVIIAAKFKL